MSQQIKSEAQAAVATLEDCAHRLLRSNPHGLRTGEVATLLGIESHVPTRNSNWLVRTILEQLVTSGKAKSAKAGNARLFTAVANPSLHLTGYSGLRPLPPAGEL